MASERRKREEDLGKLMGGSDRSGEPEDDFDDEIRKAASAVFEKETIRLRKEEELSRGDARRAGRLKAPIKLKTAGLWLLAFGAVLALIRPTLGAAVMLCGIAVIVWTSLMRPSGKRPSRQTTRA